MEIEHTASPLETNDMLILPRQRIQDFNVCRMVEGDMPILTGLWLTVRVGYNVETKSRT